MRVAAVEDDAWTAFLGFSSRGAGEVVAAILEAEEVPTRLYAGCLSGGVQAEFILCVPVRLRHRARWVLAESDFTDAELDFLATGEVRPPE
jgi:hypothetical protein